VIALLLVVASAPQETRDGLPLLLKEDFESGGEAQWEPTDAKAWRVVTDGPTRCYELFRASDYKPAVRSPVNYSLLKDAEVSDFILEARLKSTVKEYDHRDLVIVFGYRDPTHFYYLHLATRADAAAHSVFLVDGAPRVSIAERRTNGVTWGDGWHDVRIVRRVESGTIEVSFDKMDAPIITAKDKKFVKGRIGLGSFDDTGRFDDVKLWGRK
jgi:hypothetical protein